MLEIICSKDDVKFEWTMSGGDQETEKGMIIPKTIYARFIIMAYFKSIYTLKDIKCEEYFMLNVEGEKIVLQKGTPTSAAIYIEQTIQISNIR